MKKEKPLNWIDKIIASKRFAERIETAGTMENQFARNIRRELQEKGFLDYTADQNN